MGIKSIEMKALMEWLRRGLKNKHTGSSFNSFLRKEKIEPKVAAMATEKIRKRIRLKK